MIKLFCLFTLKFNILYLYQMIISYITMMLSCENIVKINLKVIVSKLYIMFLQNNPFSIK